MKSRIAEWILSQVLPPERAISTVGDWLEDAPKRGRLWFWSCVLRTAASAIRRGLAESPLTMAGIGLLGFARSILILIGIRLVAGATATSHYRHLLFVDPTRWQLALALNLLQTWWYFQTGRWIARRTPGHELAGWVAVSLFGWLAVIAELTVIPGATPNQVILAFFLPGIAHDLILLAGALSMRRRQGQRAAN